MSHDDDATSYFVPRTQDEQDALEGILLGNIRALLQREVNFTDVLPLELVGSILPHLKGGAKILSEFTSNLSTDLKSERFLTGNCTDAAGSYFSKLAEVALDGCEVDQVCLVFEIWAEFGVRLLCSGNPIATADGTTLIGALLASLEANDALEKLRSAASSTSALRERTRAAIDWFAERSNIGDLTWLTKDSERTASFLTALHRVLFLIEKDQLADMPESSQIASLWLDSAITCVRQVPIAVREQGMLLLGAASCLFPEGVRYGIRPYEKARLLDFTENSLENALDRTLGDMLNGKLVKPSTLHAIFEGTFGEHFTNRPMVKMAGTLLLSKETSFYHRYCYESDPFDMMQYLVAAALHPSRSVAVEAMDLIIEITQKNISIASLESLCRSFRNAVRRNARIKA